MTTERGLNALTTLSATANESNASLTHNRDPCASTPML